MSRKNLVVTIGRQYGSGGREIGSTLATQLGVAYYDKKLVHLAAESSGFSVEAFAKQDESVGRGLAWLFSYAPHHGMVAEGSIPLDDQLFIAQANAIKRIAREHSCVIVGRCADYVLDDMRGEVDLVNVFVLSEEQARAERIARRNDLSVEEARSRLRQIAKRRAAYYERYTDRTWADPHNFDLTINSAHLPAGGAADVIVSYLAARGLITREELPLDPDEPRDLGEEPLTPPAR